VEVEKLGGQALSSERNSKDGLVGEAYKKGDGRDLLSVAWSQQEKNSIGGKGGAGGTSHSLKECLKEKGECQEEEDECFHRGLLPGHDRGRKGRRKSKATLRLEQEKKPARRGTQTLT